MTQLETVQQWLARAERVGVLTGAGISAESGIPVFRGPNGLWKKYRPEQLATPEAFARDPRLVWQWYDWRRNRVSQANPNPGHMALAQLEGLIEDFSLITQNVDGLHDRAGSRRLLKLHGDLWAVRCLGCGREEMNRELPLRRIPPLCVCGGLLRPGVVWFGEALPADTLRNAVEAAGRSQVFLVVGTSATVYPAASLPQVAKLAGAQVVEINVEKTPLSDSADASFRGRSAEILPRLVGKAAA